MDGLEDRAGLNRFSCNARFFCGRLKGVTGTDERCRFFATGRAATSAGSVTPIFFSRRKGELRTDVSAGALVRRFLAEELTGRCWRGRKTIVGNPCF